MKLINRNKTMNATMDGPIKHKNIIIMKCYKLNELNNYQFDFTDFCKY